MCSLRQEGYLEFRFQYSKLFVFNYGDSTRNSPDIAFKAPRAPDRARGRGRSGLLGPGVARHRG
jgi:hypothetical protein